MKDHWNKNLGRPKLAHMTWRHTGSGILAALLAACATGASSEPRSPATTSGRTHSEDKGSVTMTDTRTFGRILGETARAARQVHSQVLTRAGTDFERWVAFTLLAENERAVPKEALIVDLTHRLDIERSTSSEVLDRLAEAGHIGARVEGGTELIELTPAGKAYLQRVREAVNQVTHRLIAHLDKNDVDTAMNVLRAVGEAASNITATTPSSP